MKENKRIINIIDKYTGSEDTFYVILGEEDKEILLSRDEIVKYIEKSDIEWLSSLTLDGSQTAEEFKTETIEKMKTLKNINKK